MQKPIKALATLILLGSAAFVFCSTVGGKVPPVTASPATRSAEAPGIVAVAVAVAAAAPADSKVNRGSVATGADEPLPTRARPMSASATRSESRGSSDRAATETTQLTRGATPLPVGSPASPSGVATGRFQDLAGPSFALTRVTCLIDGRPVYAGPGGKSLQLFQRTLPKGTHTVTVQADYRIKNAGPFSYTRGVTFKVFSGRRFNVGAGRPVQLSVIGYEKGGPTRAFEDRLAVAIRTS